MVRPARSRSTQLIPTARRFRQPTSLTGNKCFGTRRATYLMDFRRLSTNLREATMSKLWLVCCVVCFLSCTGFAQFKANTQWKCDKASTQHSIDVGDKAGHAYAVDQINCTAVKGELAGVKEKSGVGTEFMEINGDKVTGHGEFVETLDNGDKDFFSYTFMGTLKDGKLTSGSDKWSLREGSGKLKGSKGSGTCKGTGNSDGTVTWDCTGNYTGA